jgi:hypothetical protein
LIEHVVLFRWKADASPEAISAAIAGLSSLRGKIPGLVDLTCGANFCERSQGYQCGLVVRLRDRSALETYGPHAAHQEVVASLINPILEDVIAVDYEIL